MLQTIVLSPRQIVEPRPWISTGLGADFFGEDQTDPKAQHFEEKQIFGVKSAQALPISMRLTMPRSAPGTQPAQQGATRRNSEKIAEFADDGRNESYGFVGPISVARGSCTDRVRRT
jgi:hypothetical protein